jgi:hypothetical protein
MGVTEMADQRSQQQKHHEMSDVVRPGAAKRRAGCSSPSITVHGSSVDEARSISGQEDEDVGGIEDRDALQREAAQRVVRRMVDEDHPERDAAREVHTQVPPRRVPNEIAHRDVPPERAVRLVELRQFHLRAPLDPKRLIIAALLAFGPIGRGLFRR